MRGYRATARFIDGSAESDRKGNPNNPHEFLLVCEAFDLLLNSEGGTGRYMQLAALGPVQNVVVLNGWQLPGGYFYNFRSFFASGAVDWQIAADNQGNIAALSFYPANIQVAPRQTSVDPDPPGGGADDPPPPPKRTKAAPIDNGGSKKVNPKSKDEACSLYPDLC